MKLMPPLLLIIFLEGYAVLSSELLAIRQTVPYVGNGTDTVSIIIAAVLMPLAFGYYAGGRFQVLKTPGGRLQSVRHKLMMNLAISLIILTLGLSHIVIMKFFGGLYDLGLKNRLLLTSIYSLLFIVTPVYLLGQTVPLVTNFFSKQRLSALTGRILFISTLGSFMGAVFCTLILMSTLGVHHTVSVTIGCLVVLVFILSKKIVAWQTGVAVICLGAALIMNSDHMMSKLNIVSNNQYHTAVVKEVTPTRTVLKLNNNFSSVYSPVVEQRPRYAIFIEKNFLQHIQAGQPRDILVIGAGGFVLGVDDNKNNYVYLDINPELKKIAEDDFLKRKLGPNKIFEATPVRAYLSGSDKKFDMVIIDTFFGYHSMPEHLLTYEFFEQVKAALKPGAIVVANMISSANFSNELAANIDATWHAAFEPSNRQVVGFYNAWNRNPEKPANVLYTYFHHPETMPHEIYTDNLNRSYIDRNKGVGD